MSVSKTPMAGTAAIHPAAMVAVIKINLVRRPLWEAETVEEILDVSRRELIQKIECGEIPWAWDFASGPSRRELRILGHCIVEIQNGPLAGIVSTRNMSLPEVLNLILPKVRQSLRGVEVQKLFLLHPTSIQKLSRTGDLEKIAEKLPATGLNASPRFTRSSLVNFLTKRRLA